MIPVLNARSGLGQFGMLQLEERLAAPDGAVEGRALLHRLRARQQFHERCREVEDLQQARRHHQLAECHRVAGLVLGRANVGGGAEVPRVAASTAKAEEADTDEALQEVLEVAHLARVRGWERESEQILEPLAAACPDRAFALIGLALLRFDQGRYPQARTCLEQARRRVPGHALVDVWLGMVAMAENRLAAAALVFQSVADQTGEGAAQTMARAMLQMPELAPFQPRRGRRTPIGQARGGL